MTQKEKARAYDEALERASRIHRFSSDIAEIKRMEQIFPELKESEDEKVKRIIHSISNKISFHLHDIFTEEEFQCFDAWSNAWLKKQGKSKWTDEDECPKWFEKQGEKPHGKTALEAAKEEKVDNADKVEPKFKVKYAGNEYNVFETKDIAGVTFYGIEDEPNHIDYVKAENCEIISVYAIKENGSPYPTKPAVFSEKKPKRMISAEAKECIYGSDNEQVSSEKIGKNDTLLDLLHKMPSYITVDGILYHFILRKTALAYTAYYAGEEEGEGKVIFVMTAFSPIGLLTDMLEELKEKGLLE